MAMRLLAACSVVLGGIEATELVLWPSDMHGTLSVTENKLVSSSSHTLGVLDTTFSIEQKGTWHEAIQTIDVAIVSSVDSGNVWTEVLAHDATMAGDAEGIHVRVNVKDSPATALEIQGNITAFLNQVLGTTFSTKTYLFANASCDVLKHAIAKKKTSSHCFVSSREIKSLPNLKIPTFFQQSDTPLQSVLASQLTKHTVKAGEWELLYTQLTFSPTQSKLSVAFHQVAQTTGEVLFSPQVGFVQAIDDNGQVQSSLGKHKVNRITPKITNVQPKIIGNGFHQTMNIAFNLNTNDQCSLLVIQPFPATAYADMDELRRLERFGAFQLIGFSKHIEIERPAAISTEHVVAFLKNIPQGGAGVHTFEFPIHFRYQSPSKNVLYRPANLIAPSMFIQCGSEFSSDAKDWTRVVSSPSLLPLTIAIPIGNLNHGQIVTGITLMVSIIGCLSLYKSFPNAKLHQKQA